MGDAAHLDEGGVVQTLTEAAGGAGAEDIAEFPADDEGGAGDAADGDVEIDVAEGGEDTAADAGPGRALVRPRATLAPAPAPMRMASRRPRESRW